MSDREGPPVSRRDAIAWAFGSICASAAHQRLVRGTPVGTDPSGNDRAPEDEYRQIVSYLSRLEGFGFSGGLLVARDGKAVVRSTQGLADRGTKTAWTADTIFDTGSVTKQFTAAAIVALEADGRLQVSDPIAKYFTGIPADKTAITIHQLLTHTAGMAEAFGDDYETVSRDEMVTRAMTSTLLTRPGERHAYSNAGFSLLAAIVEIVSGKDIDRFSRDRLFRPAGMTSSGYRFSAAESGRLARGYRHGEDARLAERATATGGEMWNLIGNGGLCSTLDDLHRWMLALQGDEVLPLASRNKLFQPHVLAVDNYAGSGFPLYYGYGWYNLKEPSGKTLIWHLGGNGITNTAIRFHRDDRTWILYASNVSEYHDPRYPVPAVERILTGEAVDLPPKVVPLGQRQLERYAGTYRTPAGSALTLTAGAGYLVVTGEGQEAFVFAVAGEWRSTPEFDTLNERTAAVLEASRMGRFDEAARFYGPSTSVAELTNFETAFWKKRHDRLGDYRRTRVLGTIRPASRRFVGQTFMAVDFTGGTTWREYYWTPQGTIGDVGPIVGPPTSEFFPVSEECLVAFDPATAKAAKLCLESLDGKPVLRIPGSDISLSRDPPG